MKNASGPPVQAKWKMLYSQVFKKTGNHVKWWRYPFS